MNIRNYTSGIAVETTIARIEQKLAAAGASGITKHYDTRARVCALVFSISLQGKDLKIRVPANSEECFNAMWKEHCLKHSRVREETKETIRDQAVRTAWKLVQDWVDIQISMIVMKQADFVEVFMPYIWDGSQTFYQHALKTNGFRAMLEEKNE